MTLTGGETTLHPAWLELIELARGLHLQTTLKTNAIGFSAARAAAYARGPAHATEASLYGASAEAHDAFTTTPGSFERTLAGLRRLAEAGVPVTVSCLVWHGNAHQLPQMRSLVESLGHAVSFSDVIHGRLSGDRAPLALRIAPETRARLVAEGFLQPFSPEPCIAGTLKIKIEPDGALSPCELAPGRRARAGRSLAEEWRAPRFAAWSAALLRLATSERDGDGRALRSCPAMNRLNTGHMTGPTCVA